MVRSLKLHFLLIHHKPEKLDEFKQYVEKYGESVRISFVESKSF